MPPKSQLGEDHGMLLGKEWIVGLTSFGCAFLLVAVVLGLIVARRKRKPYGYPALDTSSPELMILQRGAKKDLMYTTKAAFVQDSCGYHTFDSPPLQYGISESLRMYEFNVRTRESESPVSLTDLPATPCSERLLDSLGQDVCGRINLSIQYAVTEAKLCVSVEDVSGLNPLIVVMTAFLDDEQQSDHMKKWSDIKQGDKSFHFIVRPDDVANARLQVNVLVGSEEKFCMGACLNAESSFDLSELDDELDEPVFYDLPLAFTEKRSKEDSITETPPPSSTYPQLLIGLLYMPAAGKLVVSILRGANYGVYCSKPDTFVKATLISPYGEEIEKRTTDLCQQNSSPQFNEEFVFQISDSELDYIHVTISVFCLLGIWQRKTPLGVVTLGAQTGDRDIDQHWKQMKLDEDETVVEWHRIVEP